MTIQELDRNFLYERSEILNSYLSEEIDFETAKVNLDLIDFKFETLIDLEKIPVSKRR